MTPAVDCMISTLGRRGTTLVVAGVFLVGCASMALLSRLSQKTEVLTQPVHDSRAAIAAVEKLVHALDKFNEESATHASRDAPASDIRSSITHRSVQRGRREINSKAEAPSVRLSGSRSQVEAIQVDVFDMLSTLQQSVHAMLQGLNVLARKVNKHAELLDGGPAAIDNHFSELQAIAPVTTTPRPKTTTATKTYKTKAPDSRTKYFVEALAGGSCLDIGPNGVVNYFCRNSTLKE